MNPDENMMQLHERAMEASQAALLANIQGDKSLAKKLYEEAYTLENQVVEHLRQSPQPGPTELIFTHSAAALAMKCGKWAQALALARRALSLNPPAATRLDLETIMAETTSQIPPRNGLNGGIPRPYQYGEPSQKAARKHASWVERVA